MEKLVINGGTPLKGSVEIVGAKNSAVALLPATLLIKGVCTINNLPNISDIKISCEILKKLGSKITWNNEHSVTIDNTNIIRTKKHNISIKYENIPLKVLEEITNEINNEVVNVDYFFGTMQNGDFQVDDMNIDLVFCEYDKYGISNSYWNLSFELKEF